MVLFHPIQGPKASQSRELITEIGERQKEGVKLSATIAPVCIVLIQLKFFPTDIFAGYICKILKGYLAYRMCDGVWWMSWWKEPRSNSGLIHCNQLRANIHTKCINESLLPTCVGWIARQRESYKRGMQTVYDRKKLNEKQSSF